MDRKYPPREVVDKLLANDGKPVTVTEVHMVEDVDGVPAGVTTERAEAVLSVSPELLMPPDEAAAWRRARDES